jgi:hypothetical protein
MVLFKYCIKSSYSSQGTGRFPCFTLSGRRALGKWSAASVSHSIDSHQSELALFRVIGNLIYLIESFKISRFRRQWSRRRCHDCGSELGNFSNLPRATVKPWIAARILGFDQPRRSKWCSNMCLTWILCESLHVHERGVAGGKIYSSQSAALCNACLRIWVLQHCTSVFI